MLTTVGPALLEFKPRFGIRGQVVLPLLRRPFPLFAPPRAAPAADRTELHRAEGSAFASSCLARLPRSARDRDLPRGWTARGRTAINTFTRGRAPRGRWVTAGGRVVGVTARCETLESARDAAYGAAAQIRFGGMRYRKDIARNPAPTGKGAA